MDSPQATSSGARSRALGSSMPRNFRPAVVNSSRFCTRNAAKKTISRILANSPGWIENGPSRSHSRAPLTSEIEAGSTPGSASSTSPAKPAV